MIPSLPAECFLVHTKPFLYSSDIMNWKSQDLWAWFIVADTCIRLLVEAHHAEVFVDVFAVIIDTSKFNIDGALKAHKNISGKFFSIMIFPELHIAFCLISKLILPLSPFFSFPLMNLYGFLSGVYISLTDLFNGILHALETKVKKSTGTMDQVTLDNLIKLKIHDWKLCLGKGFCLWELDFQNRVWAFGSIHL